MALSNKDSQQSLLGWKVNMKAKIGCTFLDFFGRWALVLLVVSSIASGFADSVTSGGDLSLSARSRSRALSKKGRSSRAASAALPSCPPAGRTPIKQSLPGTGHHKVLLSWNASSRSAQPKSSVVGYCLYRSKKQYAAKQNPTCSDCEQINRTPVIRTSCVDDLVQDNAKYYYVVTAINARGKISSSSNEVPALIPAGKQTNLVTSPHRSCRALDEEDMHRRPNLTGEDKK